MDIFKLITYSDFGELEVGEREDKWTYEKIVSKYQIDSKGKLILLQSDTTQKNGKKYGFSIIEYAGRLSINLEPDPISVILPVLIYKLQLS